MHDNLAGGLLPDIQDLHVLLGEVLDGSLGTLVAEELGADDDVVSHFGTLCQAVVEHVLEEECIGEECPL